MRLSGCVAVGVGLAVALSACGGESATPTPLANTDKAIQFELSSGDDVKFSESKLEVEAGSNVSLTFVNKSTDKLFNWVLAQPGRMLRVVSDGQQAGESSGYVKANDENIIAHTKLLKAGESDTITFSAPPPGEYQFFSTFPGYYTRLNGTLTVK